MTYTIQELINDSIRFYPGMLSVWPKFNVEEKFNFDVATFNGSYASNNGTLAFVIDNTLYVTPITRRALLALDGFTKKQFYVPFSNGDYPKEELCRWKKLRAMQDEQSKKCFVEDCLRYAKKYGVGTLSEDVLARCFEIPEKGVYVKHVYFEDWVYPTFAGHYFDCYHMPEMLGTYCTNNGRVVFIYKDGRTFVTKGYKILDNLRAAGFKEGGLFVPFSNGEVIQDPALRAKWEAIKK